MNKTAFAALALFAASSAMAGTNLVSNGSFEDFSGISSNTTWGQTSTVNGWTSLSGDKFEIQLATNYQTAATGYYTSFNTSYDGAHYLELNANNLGAISQTLGTTAQQKYTLTFGYADRSGSTGASSMDVYWNGALLDHLNTGDTNWKTYTYTVTASAANTALKFVSTGPTKSTTYGSYLDGVSVNAVAAVPEPESYAMLLAGLGVMATIARRRNKTAQA